MTRGVNEIMLAILMIIGGVLLRLAPHIPNVAPIAATALFGGVYLQKRYAIIVPLVAMAISDYLLLYIHPFQSPMVDFSHVYPITALFGSSTAYVWGSFVISGLLGIWLRNHKKTVYILGACLLGSLQFFLITNFGVWAGGMYSRGLDGLMQSYVMGLPFFRWTVVGDLLYTGVIFGAYELAIWTAYRLQTQKVLAFEAEKEGE